MEMTISPGGVGDGVPAVKGRLAELRTVFMLFVHLNFLFILNMYILYMPVKVRANLTKYFAPGGDNLQ